MKNLKNFLQKITVIGKKQQDKFKESNAKSRTEKFSIFNVTSVKYKQTKFPYMERGKKTV